MARRQTRSLFSRLTFSTGVLIVSGLLVLSYLSVLVNPAKAWFMTLFGLLYLPLLVLTLLFFLWALLRGSRMVGVLLAVLIPSIFVAGRFVQLRPAEPAPPAEVRLISYNVGLFAHGETVETDRKALADSVMHYLQGLDADILCLQEFYLPYSYNIKTYLERWFPGYQADCYVLPFKNGYAGNVTLSRYPISTRGQIDFDRSTNLALYTDLSLGDGNRVRVFNCHFESYNISLPRVAKSLASDEPVVEETGNKMKRSITARPRQVDEVLRNIDTCPLQAIVTGDFNDNPLSYTYHRLRRGRKDAFMEAGNGFGATYSAFWPFLRIDYVLLPGETLDAVRYDVDRVPYSDHYPVTVGFDTRYKAL